MMSSVCTFRLKRRRAFSSDSPSCSLTSAKETTPPNWSFLDPLVIASKVGKVKNYMEFTVASLLAGKVKLESQAQGKLKLPRRVGAGRLDEVCRYLVVREEVIDSKTFSAEVELGLIAHQAIIRDLIAAVQAVEQVEGLGGEFQAPAGERHLKRNVGYAADIHVQGLTELRRHCLGSHARCIPRGQEFEGELSLAVGGLLIAEAGGG